MLTDPLLSPTGPSAADRFSSPSPGSAKRRLFTLNTSTAEGSQPAATGRTLAQQLNTGVSDTVVPGGAVSTQVTAGGGTKLGTQHLVAFQQVITQDGRQVSMEKDCLDY